MSFYLYAWVATIFFGLEIVTVKLTSKYSITNPWLFNFLASLFFLIFTIPEAMLNHAGIPHYWSYLVLAAVTNALMFIFNILAIYLVDVSVFASMRNLRIAFAVLLSVLFLNEQLLPMQILLVCILFLAGIFACIDEKLSLKSFFTWSISIVIIDMFLQALTSVFLNKAVAENGYWTTNLWLFILIQLLLLFTIPFFKSDIAKISIKKISSVIVVSFIGIIGTLAQNKAFADNVGISTVIISIPSAMLIAFFLSLFNPRLLEKHTLKIYVIRFIAAFVMIIAALKLTL